MSRRAPPTAAQEKAAQNQLTIKSLLKLEGNKSCADCKKNKHPRWASWNLGIFICIRCSGIHRGMGTHISRVKSVDLDAWTDEQLQSVIRWGNAKANVYWESKLAAGHVPSDAKMENFIRTKYESKRWVMDGPIPDPATLGDDDEAPLNVIQERAKLERANPQSSTIAPPRQVKPAHQVDLFGDLNDLPVRPTTTTSTLGRAESTKTTTTSASKPTKAADSLLGLDFFGGTSSSIAQGDKAAVAPSAARPDFKQSILSLYASTPKPPTQSTQQHSSQVAQGACLTGQQSSSMGGLDDAFGGLGMNNDKKEASRSTPGTFDNFNNLSGQRVVPQNHGGGFFENGSKNLGRSTTNSKASGKAPIDLTPQISNDFGDFMLASSTSSTNKSSSQPSKSAVNTSANNDLFDISDSTVPPPRNLPASIPPQASKAPTLTSAFDLSSRMTPMPSAASKPTSQPSFTPAPTTTTSTSNFSAFSSNTSGWEADNAWASPDPVAAEPAKPVQTTTSNFGASAVSGAPSFSSAAASGPTSASNFSLGNDFASDWGTIQSSNTTNFDTPPQASSNTVNRPAVVQEDDFGGWSSAVPPTPKAVTSKLPSVSSTPVKAASSSTGGGGGGDDLFSNVWE